MVAVTSPKRDNAAISGIKSSAGVGRSKDTTVPSDQAFAGTVSWNDGL